jgi:superfamily II DNA/RNA helicase
METLKRSNQGQQNTTIVVTNNRWSKSLVDFAHVFLRQNDKMGPIFAISSALEGAVYGKVSTVAELYETSEDKSKGLAEFLQRSEERCLILCIDKASADKAEEALNKVNVSSCNGKPSLLITFTRDLY